MVKPTKTKDATKTTRTVYLTLPRPLHHLLRLECVEQERALSEVIADALRDYLITRGRNPSAE